MFEIKKNPTGNYISNASKYLKEQEGEYVYLINRLKKVYVETDGEGYPGLGNVIRQVLEIFLFFKEPTENSMHTAFRNLLEENPNLEKYLFLNDITNAASHPIDQDSNLHDFDYMKPIGKEEIQELFNFIKDVDPEHAQKLKLPVFC